MQGLFILLLAGASFLTALIFLAVVAGRRDRVPPDASSLTAQAQQILDERLARGEIEVDDYLARRAALRGERLNGTEYRPDEPTDDGPPAEPPEEPMSSKSDDPGL